MLYWFQERRQENHLSKPEYDYGDDELEDGPANKSDGLARLSELVTEMAQDALEIERAKFGLKEKQEKYEVLTRRIIPDLMEELGQDACKTTSGLKISIRHVVKASISNKNRNDAVAWFKEQNLERMLKDEFVLKLSPTQVINKGEDNEEPAGAALIKVIEELGLDYDNKKTCHASTLGAFVRERDAAGEETPDAILGVFRYRQAKIG